MSTCVIQFKINEVKLNIFETTMELPFRCTCHILAIYVIFCLFKITPPLSTFYNLLPLLPPPLKSPAHAPVILSSFISFPCSELFSSLPPLWPHLLNIIIVLYKYMFTSLSLPTLSKSLGNMYST